MEMMTEHSPEAMSLEMLIARGTQEMQKYHRREANCDSYSMEILRRAIMLHDQEAWAALQALLKESMHIWLACHPYRKVALRYEPAEQNYVDDAFRRFWQAIGEQGIMFSSLASALKYLRQCLNCAVLEALRAYARPRAGYLPDDGAPGEPLVEDAYDEGALWEVMKNLLPDKREQRLAYLFFHCNLKPREIMHYCPGEFREEMEIYRMKRTIMARLLRHSDQIRWHFDGRIS
jgi:hypothetical protein